MEYEAVKTATEKMEKSVAAMLNEFSNIRAGRANPQLLNRVMVDYYGTQTPITQIGNIAVPEPRILTFSLWDASMMKAVEKAIQASDLGLNPSNDGKMIRLVFPELTQERRQELVKMVAKKAEEAKVAVRSIRRDANDKLKKDQKASVITEDDLKALEKNVQDLTDKTIKKIDDLLKDKQKEITEL
ncbi:MAG: ribosome recycling factor [Christensenellaceae bacterium]|nr:ribosome recycling factor [Christensenellaceae bacterium]